MKDSRYQTEYTTVFSKKGLHNAEVSVIITLYNYSQYIIETLESVKSQTLNRFDLVIVDDHSTDNSLEITEKWLDKNAGRFNRIQLIQLKKNYGLTYSRNTAIENTETEFIFSLDADNLILDKCLEMLYDELKNSDASFAYPILQKFGDEDGLINTSYWNVKQLTKANYIDNMVLLRKSIWAKVGGYSNHIPYTGWEDYDLWFKIAREGGWGLQVPHILAKYRVHNKSMLRTVTNNYAEGLMAYLKEEYNEFFMDESEKVLKSEIKKLENNINTLNAEINNIDTQLKEAKKSFSWKIMLLLHRIYNELIKSFSLDFFKWLYYRIFTKNVPDNLDLGKYEPIDLNFSKESLQKFNGDC